MGVKLSGSRFTVMKGPVARTDRAFSELSCWMCRPSSTATPSATCLTRSTVSRSGTGQLPKFEGDLFAAKKGGQEGEEQPDHTALYLIYQRGATYGLCAMKRGGSRLAHQADCTHTLLLLEEERRARHAWPDSPARVQQGGDGELPP